MLDMKMRSFNRGDGEMLEVIDNKSYDFGEDVGYFVRHGKSCRVAEIEDNVVGFYICEVHSKISLNILRFGVAPLWRRKGVGSAMIDDIFSEGWNYSRVITSVSEFNLDAHLFLQANHFACIRTLRDEDKKVEDFYLFAKDVGVTHP